MRIEADTRFVTVPVWVLDSMSWGAVALYGVLQDYAHHSTGGAYPGRALLAERMRCSKVTVDKYVRELAAGGALRVFRRYKAGTRERASNMYVVVTADPSSAGSVPESGGFDVEEMTAEIGGQATLTTYASHVDHPRQEGLTTLGNVALQEQEPYEQEPYEQEVEAREARERPADPSSAEAGPAESLLPESDVPRPTSGAGRRGSAVVERSSGYPPEFEEFWQVYPRRTAKRAALGAWKKAARRASVAEIMAGAERFRDDPNREQEFTPHPATWLNQDRWGDDPLPERRSHLTASERRAGNTRSFLERVIAEEEGEQPWRHLEA